MVKEWNGSLVHSEFEPKHPQIQRNITLQMLLLYKILDHKISTTTNNEIIKSTAPNDNTIVDSGGAK